MFKIENTFITIAPDCTATAGTIPPDRAPKSIAQLQYDLLSAQPYKFDINELNFAVHILRNGITLREVASNESVLRDEFFSQSHPCLRASALTKTCGWGAHYDGRGHIALHGMETQDYARLSSPWSGLKIEAAFAGRK